MPVISFFRVHVGQVSHLASLIFGLIGAVFSVEANGDLMGRSSFSCDWRFVKGDPSGAEESDFDGSIWESIRLPHTANIEPHVVNDQWQGVCWYRKEFMLPAGVTGKKVFLEFEAAMNGAKIWVNGKLVKERMGGYLPIVIDISDTVRPGGDNVIALRLDNRDNIYTGPKPLDKLDFNMYGGLYRNAHLIVKEPVYISHPILAEKESGGGVFVSTPLVSRERSLVEVKTHVLNEGTQSVNLEMIQTVRFLGKDVVVRKVELGPLEPGGESENEIKLELESPKLWSPDEPNLYTIVTEIRADGRIVDVQNTRLGIRKFEFRENKLFVNGEETFLRGVNRHQEYPYVGYALSDNAQYRDAKKIKDAGFNYIRLSHYPQSPAFMEACDELGIIVLDAILGWQYYLDDPRFREYCYRSARELVRRDRNYACVLGWEVSLNETRMPLFFMEELHRIVHAELPGQNVYTAGWVDDVYDIFLQARQHRIMHQTGKYYDRPYVVSEYGDWEYFSNNAGLNQHSLDKTKRIEQSSRQMRGFGEQRLLQQAYNIQEAHNDNLSTTAFGDGYWVMYDYNRGYSDDLEASGIMDIFRLPKLSYDFYRSQQSPKEDVVLEIASWWTEDSSTDVKIYSNCDEVELFLNGVTQGRQKPDADANSINLAHPPFTYSLNAYTPGALTAVGYIEGKSVARDEVHSPGLVAKFHIWIDDSGRPPEAGVNDIVFAYIAAVDTKGTFVPSFNDEVSIDLIGGAKILNVGPVYAEAGITAVLLRIGERPGVVSIQAKSGRLRAKMDFETE